MDSYEVTGPCLVCGVAKGGTVALDPSKVNIGALVEAGHVRKLAPKSVKKDNAGE